MLTVLGAVGVGALLMSMKEDKTNNVKEGNQSLKKFFA